MDEKKVKKIEEDEDDPIFPMPEYKNGFTMGIVGRKGSGKTTLLVDLLHSVYLHQFDIIIVVSQTWHLQELKMGSFKGFVLFKKFSPVVIETVRRFMEGRTERCLLILDDLGLIRLNSPEAMALNSLCTYQRHYNISVVQLGQRLTMLHTTVRSQLDCLIIFAEANHHERALLFTNFGFGDKEKFWDIFTNYTTEKHSWVGIRHVAGRYFFFNENGRIE